MVSALNAMPVSTAARIKLGRDYDDGSAINMLITTFSIRLTLPATLVVPYAQLYLKASQGS